MTLWINELSFPNAIVIGSEDQYAVELTSVHGSNFPDIQKVGVKDTPLEIKLTINTSNVNWILSQLRGSIRNKDFTLVRSDTQRLRDNKQTIFVKITSIRPERMVGTPYFTVITLTCKYAGTQASHQPTYFINSIQVDNDWGTAGFTEVALPIGASTPDQNVFGTSSWGAGHSIIRTPTWATGVDLNNTGYSIYNVARGTVGFNIDTTTVFSSGVYVYDGAYNSGNHITDLDETISFSGGVATIQQDGWARITVSQPLGAVIFDAWNSGTSGWTTLLTMYANSGAGFSQMYLLANNPNYVRFQLDTREEVEMFMSKIPSIFPGNKPLVTYSSVDSGVQGLGDHSGNYTATNFHQLKTTPVVWIGANRYYNLSQDGTATVYKAAANSPSPSDIQFWLAWEPTSSGTQDRFNAVLRRLE